MNWLILLAVVLIAIRCGLQIHMRIIQHKIWELEHLGLDKKSDTEGK